MNMKMNKVKEILKSKKWAGRIAAVALAGILGSAALLSYTNQTPELPSYTDPVLEVTIEDEETPLASKPQVDVITNSETKTSKVKMKKASTRSYTKPLKPTKKISTNEKETKTAYITVKTEVKTETKEKYTKKSKIKVVTKKITTTVTTTTREKAPQIAKVATPHTADIRQLAPNMDARVLNAFEELEFRVTVEPDAKFAGHFDSGTAKIILKNEDDTIYHELGHFVAFLSGNADKEQSFINAYNKEKALYKGANVSYSTQNSSEYFAESMKDYALNNAALKASRPETYQAVSQAINRITPEQIARAKKIYSPIWLKANS